MYFYLDNVHNRNYLECKLIARYREKADKSNRELGRKRSFEGVNGPGYAKDIF
jgi:hypothetical protein